ncbi:hypothetical protein SAMN05892883_3247 [Jatrophihabitans sp. GAS493]|nr:hypothetical protein SAMN05892883_3247 [Jatrophihabitans sp. GAS493]
MYGMTPVRIDCPTCAESTVADLIDVDLSVLDGTGACIECGTAFVIDPSLYQSQARRGQHGPATRVAA